jgi:hypothetical protein
MNMTLSKLIGILVLIALAESARAELKWEQTSVELHPTLSDKQAVAHFKYENVGKTRSFSGPLRPRAVAQRHRHKKTKFLPVTKGKLLRLLTLAAGPARRSKPSLF